MDNSENFSGSAVGTGSVSVSKGGQMQGLLNEFRGLYEGRLKRLDEAEKAGENTEKVGYTVYFSSLVEIMVCDKRVTR